MSFQWGKQEGGDEEEAFEGLIERGKSSSFAGLLYQYEIKLERRFFIFYFILFIKNEKKTLLVLNFLS